MKPLPDAQTAFLPESCLITADSISAAFCFVDSLPVFRGHFPGKPIVPGVYFLACVQLLAQKFAGTELEIYGINRVKWTAPLVPGQRLSVTAVMSEDGGQWCAKASFAHDTSNCGTALLLNAPHKG